jgi:hypothetical protein
VRETKRLEKAIGKYRIVGNVAEEESLWKRNITSNLRGVKFLTELPSCNQRDDAFVLRERVLDYAKPMRQLLRHTTEARSLNKPLQAYV